MSEPVLSATDEPFLDLAVAISDGAPIDWGAAGVADSSKDAGSVVLRLQYLERLVRGHETVRSQSSQASTPAHETVLTEACKRAAAGGEPLLDVRWGPLVILEKIGRGSFGDVYRAWDPRLDREVALKLVPERTPESVSSPVVAEGRLLARVRHPNVLTVHGAERIDGRAGIWTEYVRGETLAQEIATRGPMPPDEAAQIGIEVCRALEAVHDAGLLHRDVKAQNILRDSTGRIVLGDFGTGIEFDDQAAVAEPQIAGTPLYLAPEILDGRPASTASDLYSVGVLLYFLVTGNYPVRGHTMADVRQAHARGERVPLVATGRELPQPFVDIVETLLGADRSRRFPTAGEVAAGLAESIGKNEPPVEAFTTRPSGLGRRSVAAVALGIVVAAAALAMVTWHPGLALTPEATVTGGPATRVTAGDWILVASFDNQSGESSLDGTIDAALKRELEYSEHVRVAQRDRWEDALHLLQRPLDTPLTPGLAREVSLRDGSIRSLITGRVEKTPSGYTVTVTIVSPATGSTLATLREDAPGRAQLLPSVRRLALRLRDLFGETHDALDRARAELQRVPMPSLGALSFHSRALAQASVRDSLMPAQQHERWAGVERLERAAVGEDPTFAHAWIMLAWALRNQDQPRDDYLSYARRAHALAETATPQERLFIVGSFHQLQVFSDRNSRNTDNRKELEQAVSAYEALFTLQPDHYYVFNNLQGAYSLLGRDHDWALMRIRLADARPANVRFNIDAAAALVDEGNLAAGRQYAARAETAISHDTAGDNLSDRAYTELFRASLDWFEERPRESFERASRLAATLDLLPDQARTTARARLVFLYLALGRLHAAQEMAERGRVWEGSTPQVLAYALRARGDLDELRDYLTTRWTNQQSSTATIQGARLEFLVPTGMLNEAERELTRYRRQIPEAAVASSFYPFLMGQLEMGRGRPRETARLLQPWLASPGKAPGLAKYQESAQLLADAWEALGDAPKAIALLKTAVERRPGLSWVATVHYHLWLTSNAQLARLYRRTGQEPKARAIEQRLLKMLAIADADHPLVLELKSRP